MSYRFNKILLEKGLSDYEGFFHLTNDNRVYKKSSTGPFEEIKLDYDKRMNILSFDYLGIKYEIVYTNPVRLKLCKL